MVCFTLQCTCIDRHCAVQLFLQCRELPHMAWLYYIPRRLGVGRATWITQTMYSLHVMYYVGVELAHARYTHLGASA